LAGTTEVMPCSKAQERSLSALWGRLLAAFFASAQSGA
jgi:hypothetical protein